MGSNSLKLQLFHSLLERNLFVYNIVSLGIKNPNFFCVGPRFQHLKSHLKSLNQNIPNFLVDDCTKIWCDSTKNENDVYRTRSKVTVCQILGQEDVNFMLKKICNADCQMSVSLHDTCTQSV
jgi:hypothetical protein